MRSARGLRSTLVIAQTENDEMYAGSNIKPSMLIPDLLSRHPQVRPVFRKVTSVRGVRFDRYNPMSSY